MEATIEKGMRKEAITLLVVLLVLASGTVGFLLGDDFSHTVSATTPPYIHPSEQAILAASCAPPGWTGAIIATNVGKIPVNITEITLTDLGGNNVRPIPNGIVIEPDTYSTLSQGLAYNGNNVTIGAVSEYGNVFSTSCSITTTSRT